LDIPPLPLSDPTPVRPSPKLIIPPPIRAPKADSTMSSSSGQRTASQATVAEPAPAYVTEPEWDDSDVPPPPEAFPPGWDDTWQPDFEAAQIASRPEPKFEKNEPVSLPPEVVPAPPPEPEAEETSKAEIRETDSGSGSEARAGMVVQAVEAPAVAAAKLPSLYAPIAQVDDRAHPPKQITVLLRPTGDRERDKRRIRILHSTLTAYKGRDKFSFQIFESGRGHLIDFPNDTTRVGPDMLGRLKKLMGEESWRIDEIVFQ